MPRVTLGRKGIGAVGNGDSALDEMAATTSAFFRSASRRFDLHATKAVAWAIAPDWALVWAGLPDVKVISPTERVIAGNIFETVRENDAAAMVHGWSYDRVPASWGVGETPSMFGKVAILDAPPGASDGVSCVLEYTMSADAADAAGAEKNEAMVAHEAGSSGGKLAAYINAHKGGE